MSSARNTAGSEHGRARRDEVCDEPRVLLAAVIVPVELPYVRGVVGDAVHEDDDEPAAAAR